VADLAPGRKSGLERDDDGVVRCWWCAGDAQYATYHDTEWGFPVFDDRRLFEKLCLEGFQAGLSWLTILRKRENFRERFGGFDIERVARFTARDVKGALGDAGIVRHRGKIEATVNNARRAIELIEETGSLAGFLWSFEPEPASRPRRIDHDALLQLSKTDESTAMSRALKKRGFQFVGPTTCYAFMQSMGIVNDHLESCAIRAKVEITRRGFDCTDPPAG